MTDLPVMEGIGIVIEETQQGGFADVFGGHVKDRPVAIRYSKQVRRSCRLSTRSKVATLLPESAYRQFFITRVYWMMAVHILRWSGSGRSLIDLLVDGGDRQFSRPVELLLTLALARSTHELGLVHSDVKPGNILMADDGMPVIIDLVWSLMLKALCRFLKPK